jgi:hypothetical protein
MTMPAPRRPGLSRNWTTKGEDVLHPRLGRGRSLETDTTYTAIFGQPSLFCFEHQVLNLVVAARAQCQLRRDGQRRAKARVCLFRGRRAEPL